MQLTTNNKDKDGVRLQNYHKCGCMIFVGYTEKIDSRGLFFYRPYYYASKNPKSSPIKKCPKCNGVLNVHTVLSLLEYENLTVFGKMPERKCFEAVYERLEQEREERLNYGSASRF